MKILLILLATLFLGGCSAGFSPIVGFPNGSKAEDIEVVCTRPQSNNLEAATIYSQEILHNYRLLLSPDGGRESIPLKRSYRYYLKVGSGKIKELTFLRSNPSMVSNDAEYFIAIHFLPEENRWIGYGRCSGAPSDWAPYSWSPETATEKVVAEKRTSQYYICIFSSQKIIGRIKIITSMRRPGLEYKKDISAIRYHTPSGWMLYLIKENKIVREPNQTSEGTPTLVTPDASASAAPSTGTPHL